MGPSGEWGTAQPKAFLSIRASRTDGEIYVRGVLHFWELYIRVA